MSATASQVLALIAAHMHQMAVGQGQILAAVTRIEATLSQQTHTPGSAPEKPTGIDWKTALEVGRLTGKAAWWLAPKLIQASIGAWLLVSGWAAHLWRWAQALIAG